MGCNSRAGALGDGQLEDLLCARPRLPNIGCGVPARGRGATRVGFALVDEDREGAGRARPKSWRGRAERAWLRVMRVEGLRLGLWRCTSSCQQEGVFRGIGWKTW